MTSGQARALLERAIEWVETARLAIAERHANAAYECARTACELAGKALLSLRLGSYPRQHEIQGLLSKEALIPPNVNKTTLSRILGDWTRGTYGFAEPVSMKEAEQALRVAERMVEAARLADDHRQ